jgi:3-keto-5-aminohexanoate cleavage enzyme
MIDPLIIEVAINGETSREKNPHVPRLPREIDREIRACLDAGAAIVHNHIEDIRLSGESAAERYLEGWRDVMRDRPDAIIYPTVSLADGKLLDHVPTLARAGIRIVALDPGSTNLVGGDADDLPDGKGFVYANDYGSIRRAFALMEEQGVAPSLGIYEPSFLRATLAFHRAGRLPRGALVKFYFGGRYNLMTRQPSNLTFGLPPTAKALDAYLEMLEGSGLPWGVAVPGGCVTKTGLSRLAIERGGHVRVGLEDYMGENQPTNSALIAQVVAIARESGRPIATPKQAAEILHLSDPAP